MQLLSSTSGFLRRVCDASLLASLLWAGSTTAQLNNDTSPTSLFKSRPDLHAPIINFSILRPELLTPGYIFLAPYRNVDPGPYIYDNWGNLVWSGAGHSGPKTAHTPRVCNFRGEDHLCYFEGQQHQGFARGHGVIMNKHYQIVKTVEAAGAGASSDMHEFKMTPYSDSKTALMTVYQPRQYDLSTNPRFNVKDGMGWIVEGVFQEVDIETGRLVFEWRSLDHVDPGESWTMPGTTDTSGDGLHERSPWDYFHLNSIDKNAEGDYLISARHTSAIYKVSGQNGSIIWQLGGNDSTFKQVNFVFSYQHHARWVMENATHTRFSFLDNASNTFNRTGDYTHGWVIEINHVAGTARRIKQWSAPEPEGGMLSGSQGNIQLLPNGGAHIGWGEHAFFSEHTADGKAVQYAKVASRPSNVMIYRSNKYNWTAEPTTQPALWTYSKTGEGKMSYYVSWNGATEVSEWRFFSGDNAAGPFTEIGSMKKTGFETVLHATNVSEWSYAQAIDRNGTALRSSVLARTFVPSEKLRPFCGDDGCDASIKVTGSDRTPYNAHVNVDEQYLSPNRGFDTAHYYIDADTSSSSGSSSWTSFTSSDDSASCNSFSATAAKALQAGTSSSTVSSLFILFIGAMIGIISSHFFGLLRRRGALRRFETPVWAFGLSSRPQFGKYQRVGEKDFDGIDDAGESSGRNSM